MGAGDAPGEAADVICLDPEPRPAAAPVGWSYAEVEKNSPSPRHADKNDIVLTGERPSRAQAGAPSPRTRERLAADEALALRLMMEETAEESSHHLALRLQEAEERQMHDAARRAGRGYRVRGHPGAQFGGFEGLHPFGHDAVGESYEELLALDEHVVKVGLSRSAIERRTMVQKLSDENASKVCHLLCAIPTHVSRVHVPLLPCDWYAEG